MIPTFFRNISSHPRLLQIAIGIALVTHLGGLGIVHLTCRHYTVSEGWLAQVAHQEVRPQQIAEERQEQLKQVFERVNPVAFQPEEFIDDTVVERPEIQTEELVMSADATSDSSAKR